MENRSVIQRDADYRRGTVLGLTIAEIFILLLFLLLLALLAMVREVRDKEAAANEHAKELTKAQTQLAEVQKQLNPWRGVIEKFKAPEEVVTLSAQKEAAERERDYYQQQAEALQELVDENKDSREEKLLDEAQQARKERDEAQRELRENQRQLDLLRKKGEDPPCWYQTVADAKQGTREKPLYTLNVGVFDDYMILRRRPPPPGGATDDGDATYAEEAKGLNLEALPYGEPLDDEAAARHLRPLHEAGETESVRSYACKFWLYVWDMTSPDAKERWKRAHDQILEGMFGTYTVKDEPWPGSVSNNALMRKG